jgi:hypothetical protein
MTPEGKKKILFGVVAVAVLGGGWWWWSSRTAAVPERRGQSATGSAFALAKQGMGHNVPGIRLFHASSQEA